jgi:hypothetical protein
VASDLSAKPPCCCCTDYTRIAIPRHLHSHGLQVKRNVQRTLATELQKLSVQFRKQQKQHLNQLRQQKEGVGGSWLDTGPSGDAGDEYDPGFSDIQVRWRESRR